MAPMPNYSLRTGIMSQLALLIVSAMLLIHVVTVKFLERDLMAAELARGRLLVQAFALSGELETLSAVSLGQAGKAAGRPPFAAALLEEGGFSYAVAVNQEGNKVFAVGSMGRHEGEALAVARECLERRERAVAFKGRAWGVTWLVSERLHMAAPFIRQGRVTGAVGISSELGPLYADLRKTEGMILLYILLNTVVLVLVGAYLLSGTVVRPIYGLLRITDAFHGDDPSPELPRAPNNEIGRLSRSLHLMLRRLEEGKAALKANIVSLEMANREIRKAQDEMIKSEKLASVGRLATGVAHEVGNPLSIVTGYLELLKSGQHDEEERMDYLDHIEYEIDRIGQTIRQLLAFSESGGARESTRVHAVIRETIAGMEPHFMKGRIQVKPSFGAADDRVWAHPYQLKQVISSVMLNATEAMWPSEEDAAGEPAGLITVATRNQAGRLRILFTNTGPGISQEALSHIFEPFFTTKERGRGRGLGLAVCHRIVDDLGGRITVERAPGMGTAVTIDIPLFGPDNAGQGRGDSKNGTGARPDH